jgi:hypothetical protein
VYVQSGFKECELNPTCPDLISGINQCELNSYCTNPIYKALSSKFKVHGKRLFFTDRVKGEFSVPLSTSEMLTNNHYEHTAELKRLLALREMIEEIRKF